MGLIVENRVVSLFFGVIFGCLQVSIGAVYKVGDSAGWTTIGNVDYKRWATTKTFRLNDIILFEYSSQFHNVMQVKHAEYKTCNVSAPIATHTTGNISITITNHGHHFFLCGVPGHCQAGQKVDINVLHDSSMAPTPTSSSYSVPVSIVPAPSPGAAAPLNAICWIEASMGLLAWDLGRRVNFDIKAVYIYFDLQAKYFHHSCYYISFLFLPIVIGMKLDGNIHCNGTSQDDLLKSQLSSCT